MKKLTLLAVITVIFCFFSLTGCYVHGRGGHGGRYFWGGMAVGAIVAPLIYNNPPEYYYPPPTCYDRVVRRGHYVRDYYGYHGYRGYHRIWVPPVVVRECR